MDMLGLLFAGPKNESSGRDVCSSDLNPHIVELEEDVDSDDTITQKDIKQINFDIAGWLRSQH